MKSFYYVLLALSGLAAPLSAAQLEQAQAAIEPLSTEEEHELIDYMEQYSCKVLTLFDREALQQLFKQQNGFENIRDYDTKLRSYLTRFRTIGKQGAAEKPKHKSNNPKKKSRNKGGKPKAQAKVVKEIFTDYKRFWESKKLNPPYSPYFHNSQDDQEFAKMRQFYQKYLNDGKPLPWYTAPHAPQVARQYLGLW